MSRINAWRPDDRATYLRHPDSRRVLELFAPHEFIASLKLVGYTVATRADYAAQQAALDEKHERARQANRQ